MIDGFGSLFSLLYLYRVNIPFPKDLGRPEKYGFAREYYGIQYSLFGSQLECLDSVQDEEFPLEHHGRRVTGRMACSVRTGTYALLEIDVFISS